MVFTTLKRWSLPRPASHQPLDKKCALATCARAHIPQTPSMPPAPAFAPDRKDTAPKTPATTHPAPPPADRKSVVSGTRVSVRVDLGRRLIIKKKTKNQKR